MDRASESVLGRLRWTVDLSGQWRISSGDEFLPGVLERQTSKTKATALEAVYDPVAFQNGTHWSRSEAYWYDSENGGRWVVGGHNLPPGMQPGSVLRLELTDPLIGGGTQRFTWEVEVQPSGKLKTRATQGQSSPALTLNLNPAIGEYTGVYAVKGANSLFIRRYLRGVFVSAGETPSAGAGWVQASDPSGSLMLNQWSLER
jgi:hypothetical protein